MRIGIDAQPLFGPRTGINRYLSTLLDALLVEDDPLLRFRLFGFQFLRDCTLPSRSHWKGYDQRCLRYFPGRVYFKLLQVGIAFPIDFDCDVYFFSNFIGYPVRRGRTCVVVHDLSFLRYPQFTEPGNLRYLRMALPRALARADHVLADSQATARDLDEFYRVGQKVSVIPVPLSPAFRTLTDERPDGLEARYGISRPFLLCVGTIEPRKNFEGMVRAYSRLPPRLREAIDLVIVGGKGWLDEPFYWALEQSPVRNQIRVLRRVADEDLVLLYNRAFALVLPSFYEGFGLPIIEAMVCSCPVITSDASAMPEVAGNAALLIPPGDDAALADAIVRLADDPILRSQLVARGQAQAERFRPSVVVDALRQTLVGLA